MSLFLTTAQLFSRLCGRNSDILEETIRMIEHTVRNDSSEDTSYMTEMGFQLLLAGRLRDSQNCFQKSLQAKVDDSNAIIGLIWQALASDKTKDAANRLEELLLVDQSLSALPTVMYLQAVLMRKQQGGGGSELQRGQLLSKALDKHLIRQNAFPLGPDFYITLNADFVIEVCQEYLHTCPDAPVKEGQAVPIALKKCDSVLRNICKHLPGLVDGAILSAKVRYLLGDLPAALNILSLINDSSIAETYILRAQIHLHQGQADIAHNALETGISYNFEIKDHPLYQLLNARILKHQKQTEQSIELLRAALKQNSKTLPKHEKITLYLELIDCHLSLNHQIEATKLIEDGIREFSGQAEEKRLQICNADLSLSNGDVVGAERVLREFRPEDSYYPDAQEKLADIALNVKKDRKEYLACYKHIYEADKSLQTLLLLGNAYMKCGEADKAIQIYERALGESPNDHVLAAKIGEALVKTHNYAKAISYYYGAIQMNESQTTLYADMIDLLLKLKKYDKISALLDGRLQTIGESPIELHHVVERAKLLFLSAKLHLAQNKLSKAVSWLEKAREQQLVAIKRCNVEQADAVHDMNVFASEICFLYATSVLAQQAVEDALRLMNEAASFDDQNGRVTLEIARLHLLQENYDKCQELCLSLLHKNLFVTDATLLLADVLVKNNDFQAASECFQKLIKQKATNYGALSRLIDLLAHAGRLADAEEYLNLCAKNSLDAGYNFCMGLFEWHSGRSTSALKAFNKARKDAVYGEQSLCNMIEICLNPDAVVIGGEFLGDFTTSGDTSDSERAESEEAAVKTAERLIKELPEKPGNCDRVVYECFLHICMRRDASIHAAIKVLTSMMQENGVTTAMIYLTAVGFKLLGDVDKARHVLKQFLARAWVSTESRWLEKCCLLAADIHLKYDKAEEARKLLDKCLKHNKSCVKAFEYLGAIQERQKETEGAIESYESAWTLSDKTNANIGYKLAVNLLKCERWVDCIEVCLVVLKRVPDYPKIKKNVLDVARSKIRC